MKGVAHINENLQGMYVYIIPLINSFSNMEGVAHRNEKCNVYVYIIPLITYFPNMEGVAHRNENCNVCICILFPWSPISPNMEGLLTEMRIAMTVYVYITYSLEGVAQKRELQCLYVYTNFPVNMEGVGGCSLISPNGEFAMCNVCMYIIPLITYFPNMDG